MTEIGKDIKDYEGFYQISNQLRVKRLVGVKCRKERFIKPRLGRDGYIYIGLRKNGEKQKKFKLHRLVAFAFIPNPENKPQINHINEIKTDNRIENLEWVSVKENINYGTRNKKVGQKLRKLQDSDIKEIRNSNLTLRELGKIYNVGKSTIKRIKDNQVKIYKEVV